MVGLNSIQPALDHSEPSNTTPLGANLQLIECAHSILGNTVYILYIHQELSSPNNYITYSIYYPHAQASRVM